MYILFLKGNSYSQTVRVKVFNLRNQSSWCTSYQKWSKNKNDIKVNNLHHQYLYVHSRDCNICFDLWQNHEEYITKWKITERTKDVYFSAALYWNCKLHSHISYLDTHYENMPIQIYRKLQLQKLRNFQIKNPDIFHISVQNIDCGYSLEPPRRGGSNEYLQSMFLGRNKKIMYTPVNPSFTI